MPAYSEREEALAAKKAPNAPELFEADRLATAFCVMNSCSVSHHALAGQAFAAMHKPTIIDR
jgi:transposase